MSDEKGRIVSRIWTDTVRDLGRLMCSKIPPVYISEPDQERSEKEQEGKEEEKN